MICREGVFYLNPTHGLLSVLERRNKPTNNARSSPLSEAERRFRGEVRFRIAEVLER